MATEFDFTLNRRSFMKAGAATSVASFTYSVPLWAGSEGKNVSGNAWIKLGADNSIEFILDKVEMGQGVYTSLSQIVAEELDVDPRKLTISFAPPDPVYRNRQLNMQVTGGSSSVSASYDLLRNAASQVRMGLIQCAATKWGTTITACTTDGAGRVIHTGSSQQADYGTLVEELNRITLPEAQLKKPADFRYIGKSIPRLDAAAKVHGAAGFGVDVNVPDMLAAAVLHAPIRHATATIISDKAARESVGVKDVVAFGHYIAVVADRQWQALQAIGKVEVKWSGGDTNIDSKELDSLYAAAPLKDAKAHKKEGKPFADAAANATVVEAVYSAPYLAHATMEPMNATAHVREDGAEIWAPTQSPEIARELVAEVTGLSRDKIQVHTTFLGGGFGRRIVQDFVVEAAQISMHMKRPIKMIWTREDDFANDYYRPKSLSKIRGAIDAKGDVVAWEQQIISASILSECTPDWVRSMLPGWVPRSLKSALGPLGPSFMGGASDNTSTEGASDSEYDVPNFLVAYSHMETTAPVGFWRSVGHSQNAFAVECFVDELAAKAQKSPLKLRQELLAKSPRALSVLNLAAEKGRYGQSPPAGTFRGIARHFSFRTHSAAVVEITKIAGKDGYRVSRVSVVMDCGQVINPDLLKCQMESSVIFGLSAALKGEITFTKGQADQSNFHNHEVLRMNEVPLIETHIVASNEPPTGAGEPAVPPLAPAVAAAYFAATGKRLRTLPLKI